MRDFKTSTSRPKPPAPWPLIILFLVISACGIITDYIYFNYQKKTLLTEKQQELSAISDLKIRQIFQWKKERIGDGEFLGGNTLLVRRFSRFINKVTTQQLKTNILQSLKSLTENYDYRDVILLDTTCHVRLAYPNEDTVICSTIQPLLRGIIDKRDVVLTDLHRSSLTRLVHLDLMVPLIDRSVNDTLVLGLLVIRVDPQNVLFPLIETWPTPSRSAETLLFRIEGDSILYLNELRHIKGVGLELKKSLNESKLPAVMAVAGLTGTLDGIDYRNVRVVAAMKKIPGTAWYMVSKIDREEVFSVLNNQMKMVNTILILFIMTIGFFLGLLWRNQRVRYYREKYETELNRLALVKHFDYILKFANDIILLINSDLKIIEANDRALESYQYSRDEMIGMKLEEIRAPETLPYLFENISRVEVSGSATFETYHKRKDGSVFPIEISSRLVYIEGSKYYQTIGRDITERKSSEEALIASEAKFRKIFEESPFPMLMTANDFAIMRANHSFIRMIGYEEDELKSFTFRNITHPEHLENDEAFLIKLIAKEIPIYRTEKRYICKDGTIIWGSTTVSTVRNKKDEVQFFLVMIEDITSRKATMAELDKSLSLLKATLESTEDGLLVVDLNGKILQFNQKFVEMWRIPLDVLSSGEDADALNFVISQLKNPESFMENVKHLYANPDATSSDLLEFTDGRFFERYSQPQNINGKSVGRVWSFRDITKRRKAEEDLIAAKEKAEENDRLKTAFLHNVSHEIRTPMNAIIGFSTLIGEPGVAEEDRNQYIDIIFQSSNHLLSIINDIVDIANVESRQVKMNFTVINLNAALKTLNEQFQMGGEQAAIPISMTTGLPDEEANIITDKTKLIQILSNLINNAVKFTKEGHIYFGYVLKDGFLEFFVSDTGIGISQEHQEKIFDRFYQVDGTGSRQYGGTGLGLSICKAYVELLDGQISVESRQGAGSRFVFTIPYRQS